jgi:DNA-binding transcriptional ArsR family regulator
VADAYEALFTALAHPVRRRIVMTLHFEGGEMTAGAIAAMFEHAWPTTTGHLQVLEAAGVVTHTRDGRSRIYRLNRDRLALVRDWLAQLSKEPHGQHPKGRTAPVSHQRRGRKPR